MVDEENEPRSADQWRALKGRLGGGPDQREMRHLSALELLNREPYLALLGDPGSGKSTFVNFVALCLAGEALSHAQVNLTALTRPLPSDDDASDADDAEPRPQPWDLEALLPVRVVLRDLAARGLPAPDQPVSGGTLWNFIEAELGDTLKEFPPTLKQALRQDGGLVLLDGLDEVPDANQRRAQIKQMVEGFVADFPQCRFLVTSRTYAYQRQEWKLTGFHEAVLSPFTPHQINGFIDNWYAHVPQARNLNEEEALGQATLLKTAIERNERLAELAERPLLLTLMASLQTWRGGTLPEKREELYAHAVDLLLHQWESPKIVRDAAGQPVNRQPSLTEWLKVDRDVVQNVLNRLAFEAHKGQPDLVGTADIAQSRLVDALMRVTRNPDVNPARLIEYLRDRAGLLMARGEGVYSFPHRTFQEYLAACYLTVEGFPDEIADLLDHDVYRWREAALLAGAKAARGTSSAVWSLAEALCYTDPPDPSTPPGSAPGYCALLAAQTLLENERDRLDQVSERNQPKLARIRRWLTAIITHGYLPPLDRAKAGEALAVLGDDRNFDELITIPAGSFWMGDDDDSDASPQHEVTLPEYKIGKYLITNAQFQRFCAETKRSWYGSDFPDERSNHPAVAMTWHDARAYCDWLIDIWRSEGKIKRNEIVRLPSEAEWEKAARGDSDKRAFPWDGNWEENRCNSSELGLGETCVVGMFPDGANPFGCLDMAGNVFEWTTSLWGKDIMNPEYKYPYQADDGRESLEANDDILRVLRGGSFYLNQDFARCAFRLRYDPFGGHLEGGFRVVVSPNFPSSVL